MADDTELARLMRRSLERRAGDVDVAVPVAQRATAAVRRRHRGRLAVGVAAAAVAVAAVAMIASLDSTPPSESPSDAPVDLPVGEWRTEYWADIQVDVPASWAWGGAPTRSLDTWTICTEVPPDRPYVGRPVSQTDSCAGWSPEQRTAPSAPYAWVGVPLEPGTVDLGDGWTQETIQVGGSTVTVATDNDALRERILESAREASLCPARVTGPPVPRAETTKDGVGELLSATLCAYQIDGNDFELVFGSELEPRAALSAFAAVDAAPDSDERCKATDEFVVLSATFADFFSPDESELRLHQDLVYDLRCGHVLKGGRLARLTADTVAPWAVGGASASLYGPPTQWAYDYFIGAQG